MVLVNGGRGNKHSWNLCAKALRGRNCIGWRFWYVHKAPPKKVFYTKLSEEGVAPCVAPEHMDRVAVCSRSREYSLGYTVLRDIAPWPVRPLTLSRKAGHEKRPL